MCLLYVLSAVFRLLVKTLYFYFYIQANDVNIKTSSWFFCWSCKNFLSYNLLYTLRMFVEVMRWKWAKRPIEISHPFLLVFFFLLLLSCNFFFIVKTLSHDTLTANHNTDETNETNTRNNKKMKEKKILQKLTFTSHKMQVPLCMGFTTVIKILPQLLWYSFATFLSDTCFYCALSKPFLRTC